MEAGIVQRAIARCYSKPKKPAEFSSPYQCNQIHQCNRCYSFLESASQSHQNLVLKLHVVEGTVHSVWALQ